MSKPPALPKHEMAPPDSVLDTNRVRHAWNLPDPLATAVARTEDDTPIVLRRHGDPTGSRLVLSHGNGLATDLYYPFWSLLTSRFDLVLYDLRNHGCNPPSNTGNHDVATFARDNDRVFRAIGEHFGEKPWTGVFHSLSAVAALNQAPPGGGAAALVLFDPPIFPSSGDPLEIDSVWQRLRIVTRLRQGRFENRAQFAATFRRSPMFAKAVPGLADLAARVLLRPACHGGGYELCCPLEYEARIFEYIFAYNYEPDPGKIPCPVKVIGGDPTVPFSFLPSIDPAGVTGFRYDFVPETTHFLQLENPAECAAIMLRFLEQEGLA